MKKTFIAMIAAACVLTSVDMSAQSRVYRGHGPRSHHGHRYDTGIELSVGYLHSGYKTKGWEKDDVNKDKGLNGLFLGVTKDFTLVKNTLYFQTGLQYQFQTSSNKYTKSILKVVEERNEHYFDIPLRVKFAMNVLPEMRAFVYLGPTLDFGLSAKQQVRLKAGDGSIGKLTYNYFSGKTKGEAIGEYEFSYPTSSYRRFDLFLGGALGVELYDIAVVKFGFDWGLINKNKSQDVADHYITHRNLFHLGIGVRF